MVFRIGTGVSYKGCSQNFSRDGSEIYRAASVCVESSGKSTTSVMEEALTGAPHTREQQQRPYEVHEYLEVPGIQDPIRGRKGQEVVVDNFSTSDCGVAKLSPLGTIGTNMTPSSPNIFGLAVNCYGFDYAVFDEDNGDGDDVDLSDNDDDTNIEKDDEANETNVPPVAQTPNREGENHPHFVRL